MFETGRFKEKNILEISSKDYMEKVREYSRYYYYTIVGPLWYHPWWNQPWWWEKRNDSVGIDLTYSDTETKVIDPEPELDLLSQEELREKRRALFTQRMKRQVVALTSRLDKLNVQTPLEKAKREIGLI